MMRKIAHVRELSELIDLPLEVLEVIRDAVTVLDEEYGENRNIDGGYGGYVLLIESEGDLQQMKTLHIDLDKVLPEYVDLIVCHDGHQFASVLVLLGS